MSRAVRYDHYGDVDVLRVDEVDTPRAEPGRVIVEVVASSINPGEASIRKGVFAEQWPSTFPSGQGSDLAGTVVELGEGVDSAAVGDEVIGWTDERAAQADHVSVPAEQLTPKPEGLDWDVAGSLYVAGATAIASVRAVAPREGDTVVVTAAAGGVGSLAVQLARRAGATVIGVAGPDNTAWLEAHGIVPVEHGEGLRERLHAAAPDGIDAFLDNFGGGYVELALDLGVPRERINTIIDFAAAGKYGVGTAGNADGASAANLAELADLIAAGEIELPVAATYPLEQVREAYTELERRHTRGKIVLRLR